MALSRSSFAAPSRHGRRLQRQTQRRSTGLGGFSRLRGLAAILGNLTRAEDVIAVIRAGARGYVTSVMPKRRRSCWWPQVKNSAASSDFNVVAADDQYFVTGRPSLAARQAGAGAREKAKEELAKAPLRSRLGRIVRVHTDERAWRRGADGEERMGRILERLPRGWHVFHDLTIGSRGANIDHLVIGPAGVFTVNTKNLAGSVWVASRALLHNGRKTG